MGNSKKNKDKNSQSSDKGTKVMIGFAFIYIIAIVIFSFLTSCGNHICDAYRESDITKKEKNLLIERKKKLIFKYKPKPHQKNDSDAEQR